MNVLSLFIMFNLQCLNFDRIFENYNRGSLVRVKTAPSFNARTYSQSRFRITMNSSIHTDCLKFCINKLLYRDDMGMPLSEAVKN